MSNLGVKIDLYHTTFDGRKPDLSTVFSSEELENINDYYIPFPKQGKLPGHYVRESYKLSKLIFEKFISNGSKVDFVYSKNYSSWYYIEQKMKGSILPPVGVMLHGYEAYQINRRSLVARKNVFFHKKPTDFNTLHADYVFSYGGKISDIIRKIGTDPSKIIDITSGIDEDWIDTNPKTSSSDTISFAFVGRYTPRKGIHHIYHWVNNNLNRKFQIQFVGPIPEEDQIKHDQLIYHGKVTDSSRLQQILSTADVLLCPSRAEGMPNVILEGMARGCAILATDVGAVEALVDDSNGWLIPPFDQTAFDDTMDKIMKIERNVISSKGARSIEKIRNSLTWDQIAKQTLEAIEEIVSKS